MNKKLTCTYPTTLALLLLGSLLLLGCKKEELEEEQTPVVESITPWNDTTAMLYTVGDLSGNHGYILKSINGGFNWDILRDGSLTNSSGIDGKSGLRGIAYVNGRLIAVGKSILVSTDMGVNWQESIPLYQNGQHCLSGANTYLKSVAYGDGIYLVVGENYILYSTDAVTWKYFDGISNDDFYNTQHSYTMEEAYEVVWTGTRFVVCGGKGASGDMRIATFTVQGGNLVLETDVLIGDSGGLSQLRSLSYDGVNTLVACSQSAKSVYSTDGGLNWSILNSPGQIASVLYKNAKWYAVSPTGYLYTSTNIAAGFNSTGTPIVSGTNVSKIFYGNGRFFVLCNDVCYSSLTGNNVPSEWVIVKPHVFLDPDMKNGLYID